MSYRLLCENPDINRVVGHHTIEIVVVEYNNQSQEIGRGTREKHGISSEEIDSKYSGNVDLWLSSIGQGALIRYRAQIMVQADLLSMSGRTIPLTLE